MLQIKTFEFWVANSQTTSEGTEYYKACYANPRTTPQDEIDKYINSYLVDYEASDVVDIRIMDTLVNQHNNGGDNAVRRTYTIITNQ